MKIRKPQERKWVSVKERLPRKNTLVIVQTESNKIESDFFDFEGNFIFTTRKVLYWMYFPAPKIKGRKNKNHWISYNIKRPFNWTNQYLVQHAGGEVRVEYLLTASDRNFTLENMYGKALYWMPLPEPYKGVSA